MPIVTRFAPSPTGRLHLGHAHAALVAWHSAKAAAGRFLVRIEDIDRQRCRPPFEQALLEDLAWLGIEWPQPVRRQSDHLDDYRRALTQLDEMGVIYPCFCSRKDIAAASEAPHPGDEASGDGPVYPGLCRTLDPGCRRDMIDSGRPYALRLDVTRAKVMTGPLTWHDRAAGLQTARPESVGDVVLARKDTPTSYHLSVTYDDAIQDVTLVTRGRDLFQATHIHRLLQGLLGLPTPDYHHHPLITDALGRRLAKRDGAESLAVLRSAGYSPSWVRSQAGFPD